MAKTLLLILMLGLFNTVTGQCKDSGYIAAHVCLHDVARRIIRDDKTFASRNYNACLGSYQ